MIFDTHCHLYDTSYEKDPKEIIRNSLNNNVGLIMIPGDTLANSKKAHVLMRYIVQLEYIQKAWKRKI